MKDYSPRMKLAILLAATFLATVVVAWIYAHQTPQVPQDSARITII